MAITSDLKAPPKAYPSYTTAERDRRWALARKLMDEQGLDGLIAFGERDGAGPPQFCPDAWLTNDRPGMTVIMPRKGEPIALLWGQNPAMDHYMASKRGDGVWLQPESFRTGRRGAKVVEAIQDLGLATGTIGILGLETYGPFYHDGALAYNTFATMKESLPKATFKPVWAAFAELMLAKSAEEIEVLRWSAWVGEKMNEAMLAVTKPGVSETEIYAAAMHACFANAGNSYWMIMLTGADNISWGPPAWTYRPQAPRIIQNGDLIMNEQFVVYGMQETQQQLTIAVGDVEPLTERCAEVARAAYDVGLQHLKPGARFGDIVEAMDVPVKEAGGWNLTPHLHTVSPLEVAGFCGYGVRDLPGMDRYKGVGGTPTLRPDFIIKPGMAFAFEPNCAIGSRRVNIGGSVLMTDDGYEELNSLANNMRRV